MERGTTYTQIAAVKTELEAQRRVNAELRELLAVAEAEAAREPGPEEQENAS